MGPAIAVALLMLIAFALAWAMFTLAKRADEHERKLLRLQEERLQEAARRSSGLVSRCQRSPAEPLTRRRRSRWS